MKKVRVLVFVRSIFAVVGILMGLKILVQAVSSDRNHFFDGVENFILTTQGHLA